MRTRKEDPRPIATGDLVKPENITGIAGQFWDEIAPQLQKLRIVGEIDSTMLGELCKQFELVRNLEADIDKKGFTAKAVNKAGKTYIVTRPQVNCYFKALALFIKLAGEFGMYPSARTGLKVIKKPDESGNALDALMQRKGLRLTGTLDSETA